MLEKLIKTIEMKRGAYKEVMRVHEVRLHPHTQACTLSGSIAVVRYEVLSCGSGFEPSITRQTTQCTECHATRTR